MESFETLGLAVLAHPRRGRRHLFQAAKFGLSLAFVDKQVTAIWPPTGIALVTLLC